MNNIQKILLNSFHTFANIPAMKNESKIVTYKDLSDNINLKVSILKDLIDDDLCIGILGQRDMGLIEGILSSVYLNVPFVPLNSKFPLEKKISIIIQANIKLLVVNESDEEFALSLLDDSDLGVEVVLFANTNRIVRKKNTVRTESKPTNDNLSDFIYIMFTSGSTGAPKGVKVKHSNVEALLKDLEVFYPDLKPGYRSSQTFDFSFDPSICDIFFTLYKGGTICMLSESELFLPAEYIKREKINFWHSVPVIAEYLGKLGHLTEGAFPDLIYSIFTGEPCKKRVADQWKLAAPNSSIENRYGPTEATVDCIRFEYKCKHKDLDFTNGILPIGAPYSNVEYQIVNKDLYPCEKGVVGELIVSGPQVTFGYLNDAEKTLRSFLQMKWDDSNRVWYRTGDLAFFNNSFSQIECLGRIDNQIKIAGKRIEIGEIEFAFEKINYFEHIAIVPKYSAEKVINHLVAFVDRDVSREEIALIKCKIGQFLDLTFFPKDFVFIKELPVNASGKIDRKQLQSLLNELRK